MLFRGRTLAELAGTGDIQAVFERAGCTGTLYVQSLGDGADIGLAADELVTPASVVKVQIAWKQRPGSLTAG
jgi:hypothetical protein